MEDGEKMRLTKAEQTTAYLNFLSLLIDGEEDFYCPVCGEPWDVWEIKLALSGKDAALTKAGAWRLLAGKGCPCCKSRRG